MKYTTEDLREKIHQSGWKTLEIPVRRSSDPSFMGYKIVASKKDKSFILEGKTINEAMELTAKTLGLVHS
jgi:hypothetical protein